MKRISQLVVVAALSGMSSMAIDITLIPDGQGTIDRNFGSASNINDGSQTAAGVGLTAEDQEVAGNALANQSWDYEAFTQTGKKLGIVAGFDMKSGQAFGSVDANGVGGGTIFTTPQGDIFLKVNAEVDARDTGSSPNPDTDGFDFDYVIKFNSIASGVGQVSYSVYTKANVNAVPETSGSEISSGGALLTGYLYRVTPTGAALYSGSADYADNLSSVAAGGYKGTYHDVISGINIDEALLGLSSGDYLYTYTTMGCGNDILAGKYSAVPDGGMTLSLLGVGLVGIGALRRRCA